MFKRYFDNKRKQRFENMESKVQSLSDNELKEWYIGADTQRVIGDTSRYELKLLDKIEEELNRRGFEYMLDY